VVSCVVIAAAILVVVVVVVFVVRSLDRCVLAMGPSAVRVLLMLIAEETSILG